MTLRFDPAGGSAQPVQLDLPLAMPLATPLSMPGAPGLKSRAAVSSQPKPCPKPSPKTPVASPSVQQARQTRGRLSYLSGLAAEDAVEKAYVQKGLKPVARRWRGSRAEIDMIFSDGDALVFVEVKKSRSFDTALRSLGRAQCDRILEAATEFLGQTQRSQLTQMRFDLATVNSFGAHFILENAFALEC